MDSYALSAASTEKMQESNPSGKTFKTKIVWDKCDSMQKNEKQILLKDALTKRKERFGEVSPPRSKFQKTTKQSVDIKNIAKKSSVNETEINALKKRSERFGENVSFLMKEIEEKDRLLKRQAKFGTKNTVSTASSKEQVNNGHPTTVKLFKTVDQINVEKRRIKFSNC